MDSSRSNMDNGTAEWKFNPAMGEWEPAADYGNDNQSFQLDGDEFQPGVDSDGYEIPLPKKVTEAMPEVTDIDFGYPHSSDKSDVSFTKTDNTSFIKRKGSGGDADFPDDESEDDSEGNPKTLMRVLTRFADRTSMQGVPYINVSKVWYAKAGWAFLFFVGFLAMCFHLFYLIQEFYAFRTHSVVTLGFNTLNFPAVTICNVNPIKTSQMDLASEPLKSLVESVKPSQIVNSMEEKRRQKKEKRQNDLGQEQQSAGGTDPNSQQPPAGTNDQGQSSDIMATNGQSPPDEQNKDTNNNDISDSATNDADKSQTTSSDSGSDGSTTSSTTNQAATTTTRAGQSSNQSTQPPSSNQQSQFSTDKNNESINTDVDNNAQQSSKSEGQTTTTNTTFNYPDTTTATQPSDQNQLTSADTAISNETASSATSEKPSSNTDASLTSETNATTEASSALTIDSVTSDSSTKSSAVVTEASSTNDTESTNGTVSSQRSTKSPSETGTNSQGESETESTSKPGSSSGNKPPAQQSGSGSNSESQRVRRDTLDIAGKTLSRHRRFVEGFSISETNTRYQDNEDIDDGPSTYTGNKSTLRAIEDEFKFLFTSMRSSVREVMGHQIEDMLMECTFRGIECGVQNFKLIQTADYGNCFTVENENFVSVLGGPGDGLTLIFFIQDEEYLQGIANSLGFQIQIHQRGSMANPYEEGLSVSAGMETFIGLKQVNIERLGDPYGECKEGDDFESNYRFVYTQKTCQQFCIQSLILQRCQCFDTEREEVYRRIDNYQSLNVSQPCLTSDENNCLNKVYREVQVGKITCDCPSPCEETLFTKSLSSKTWPTAEYATVLVEYLCGVLNDTECETYASKSRTDLASSFLKLVIYFEDLNYENITEEENYELFQFVSDIGGTIGLWIGLSLISFFEVLQFLYEFFHYLIYVKPRQKKKLARRRLQRQQQQAVRHAIRFANDISANQTTAALQTAHSKLSRPRSIKDRYFAKLQHDQAIGNSLSPNSSTSSHGDFQSSSLRPPPFEDIMKSELHLDLKPDSLSEGRQLSSRFPYPFGLTDNRNDLRY